MGQLIKGVWKKEEFHPKTAAGVFQRHESFFRKKVTADGRTGFKAEPHRYHLYVSFACPWAHRTLIMRKLKKLENVVTVSVVEPLMLANGWEFSAQFPDHLDRRKFLYQVYQAADPHFTGLVTVPVLWDKKENTIINNESADIIRMLNSEFDAFGDSSYDFAPKELWNEMDRMNDFIYHNINNGVYKAGFASTQKAYEKAYDSLFAALDEIEIFLGRTHFLVGNRLTECDWRLFTTLIRFDTVYFGHFKCNRNRISDYPNLSRYLKMLYSIPGISETVHFDHIKLHYYGSHRSINPTGIVPKGPDLFGLTGERAQKNPSETHLLSDFAHG